MAYNSMVLASLAWNTVFCDIIIIFISLAVINHFLPLVPVIPEEYFSGFTHHQYYHTNVRSTDECWQPPRFERISISRKRGKEKEK